LALAQSNPVVGAFMQNSDDIVRLTRQAAAEGADLVAFGEMAISGYPIEDLASRPSFLRTARRAVETLAARLADDGLGDIPVVVGHPDGPFPPRPVDVSTAPTAIAKNCASILQHGRIVATTAKYHLPNYSVFDEYRVFIPGDDLLVARIADVDVAIIICEDLWREGGPIERVLDVDAGLLLVVNASPWVADKDEVRLPLVTHRATKSDVDVAYVNIFGGQDDLVFDGDSVVVSSRGQILARAPQFREHLLVVDLDPARASVPASASGSGSRSALDEHVQRVSLSTPNTTPGDLLPEGSRPSRSADINPPAERLEVIWNALVLGTRDYVQKNGFASVILGLSGGIDSAVCAAIAADAIGPERVYGVSMPSRWSSSGSMTDADDVAARIGLNYRTEPIADLVAPFDEQLSLTGLAAENIQARARALILMGLSNLDGHLVLTTGNKTELAVGYSTIYGDSVGGFAPIKDVPKTLVWELARWRNAHAAASGQVEPIPANSITKPPSAELREGQQDEDSLPPYPVLDAILEQYITRAQGAADIVAMGFDAAVVAEVTRLVDRSEWKRRQGAIGPKISGMAFGRDRRLPITYRPQGGPGA
jgi:NAD+ synthase (glutamine-hydrolysing)